MKNEKGLTLVSLIIYVGVMVIVIIVMFSIHLVEFVKIKNINLYLGSFSVVYALILILGCCNGLNLTDGLDGLATITYILSICPFVYIAIKQQNDIIVYFLISLIGSLLAFLIFNFNPSKLIMGDVGSLSLGAILAIVGLSLNAEYMIFISGFIYVIEVVSVILQVFYFKVTNGKRLFKMAPIHYHFIKKGMKESNVVLLFTIIGICLSIVSTIIGVFL